MDSLNDLYEDFEVLCFFEKGNLEVIPFEFSVLFGELSNRSDFLLESY